MEGGVKKQVQLISKTCDMQGHITGYVVCFEGDRIDLTPTEYIRLVTDDNVAVVASNKPSAEGESL